MELRQLEYFVAVAEEANFTRAAERVHISQSGVSAQIRQLEHDLGAALIDRSGRSASLTPAGQAALPQARAVLAAVSAVRQAVDEVTGLLRGRLVIGMVTACTVTPLFDALAGFHRAHPGIEIALVEGNSDWLIEQVRSGQADLALIGAAGAPPAGLDSLLIVSEPLAAAVPPGHPLAAVPPGEPVAEAPPDHSVAEALPGDPMAAVPPGDPVAAVPPGQPVARQPRATLAEVAAYPVVSLPEGTGVRAVFDQGCAAAGLRPDIALQASAPGAVADLAIRGLGVAILSASMAAAHADRLASVAIEDIAQPAVLALVWPPEPSPALRALLPHCRQAFPSRPVASERP